MRHLKWFSVFTFFTVILALDKANAQPGKFPSSALIENAQSAGVITAQKAQLYKAYLSFSPENLPKEFKSDVPEKCGTSLRKQAISYLSKLDASEKAKYKLPLHIYSYDTLDLPSDNGLTLKYETAHFILWYTTSGSNAPPLTDADASGVPDYIENAGKYSEQTYEYEVNTLGYKTPPITTIPKYYIYILNPGSGIYGITLYGYFPGKSGTQLDVLFVVNNSFSFARENDDADGKVLGAMKATVAHEFFHGVQAAYDWFEDEASGFWFAEASATWMEDEVYPDTNDYIGYLNSWFGTNGVPLDSTSSLHQYGSAIFCKFLSEKIAGGGASANPVIIKYIWEETVNTPVGGRSLDAIKTVLQTKYSATFPDVLKNFYVANYLKDYIDGAKFPGVRCTDYSSTNVNFSQSSLSRMAALYYCYASSIQKPLAISFNGSDDGVWRAALVKETSSAKTTENLSLNAATQEGYALISTFGSTEIKVAAVLVNATETTTAKYDYQSAVGGFGTNPSLSSPSDLKVIYGSGRNTLTWTAASGAVKGYKVYRSSTQGSGYALITTLGTVTTYDDVLQGAKVAGQTSFYYVVTSYNDSGESFASKESSVTVTSSALTKAYNAPNPFKTKTTFYAAFQGDSPLSVTLEIYSLTGKRVLTYVIPSPVTDTKKRNPFAYTLDNMNLASGIYVYRMIFVSLDGTPSSATGKFVVLR